MYKRKEKKTRGEERRGNQLINQSDNRSINQSNNHCKYGFLQPRRRDYAEERLLGLVHSRRFRWTSSLPAGVCAGAYAVGHDDLD